MRAIPSSPVPRHPLRPRIHQRHPLGHLVIQRMGIRGSCFILDQSFGAEPSIQVVFSTRRFATVSGLVKAMRWNRAEKLMVRSYLELSPSKQLTPTPLQNCAEETSAVCGHCSFFCSHRMTTAVTQEVYIHSIRQKRRLPCVVHWEMWAHVDEGLRYVVVRRARTKTVSRNVGR